MVLITPTMPSSTYSIPDEQITVTIASHGGGVQGLPWHSPDDQGAQACNPSATAPDTDGDLRPPPRSDDEAVGVGGPRRGGWVNPMPATHEATVDYNTSSPQLAVASDTRLHANRTSNLFSTRWTC